MNPIVIQNFNPSSGGQLLIGVVFYIALIIITFFSFATMYVLLKNGRSKIFSLFASMLYLVFFISLAAQAINSLNALK